LVKLWSAIGRDQRDDFGKIAELSQQNAYVHSSTGRFEALVLRSE